MAKDPAFLFYTSDFLSGTMFFTNEELGIYLRLLMAQHQHGHLSEKQVKIICNSLDSEVLLKFKKDAEGLYYNERLETEILKRQSYAESRANNRKGKTKDAKKQQEKKKNTSKSYVNHMENKDKDINKDNNKVESEIAKTPLEAKFFEFVKFRKAKRQPILEESMQAFKNKLWKLSKQNEQTAIEILEQSIANGWTGIFELKEQNHNGNEKGLNSHVLDSLKERTRNYIIKRTGKDPMQ